MSVREAGWKLVRGTYSHLNVRDRHRPTLKRRTAGKAAHSRSLLPLALVGGDAPGTLDGHHRGWCLISNSFVWLGHGQDDLGVPARSGGIVCPESSSALTVLTLAHDGFAPPNVAS